MFLTSRYKIFSKLFSWEKGFQKGMLCRMGCCCIKVRFFLGHVMLGRLLYCSKSMIVL